MSFHSPVIQRAFTRTFTVGIPDGLVIKADYLTGAGSYSIQKEATDPYGSYALTLTNVVVGSRVHIETQDGTTILYDAIAASSTVTPPIYSYAPGSALNDLRIRIRKASAAPYYQPYETLVTSTVGSASIFVSQVAD